MKFILTICSGRAELHYSNPDLLGSRNAHYLGLLWSVPRSCWFTLSDSRAEYQNRHGSNIGSKVFLTIVGILNAGRNSFSFFLLLIVCMGYGVVKHTLGKTMIRVRWLAAAHFLFGLVYSLTFLSITPETAGKEIRHSCTQYSLT